MDHLQVYQVVDHAWQAGAEAWRVGVEAEE